MSDEVSAEERRAAHRRGHSLPMHIRAREDAQVANALAVGNGSRKNVVALTDGQVLAVDGEQIVCQPGGGTVEAGDGLTGDGSEEAPLAVDFSASAVGQSLRQAADGFEGFWPEADAIRAILTSPVAVSTTPATVFTVALPAAGTYAIEAVFTVLSGTLAANRVVTFYFAQPGQTTCQIGWAQSASVGTSNAYGYGADFGTALPAVVFASTQDNVHANTRCWGDFTVNAAGDLTVSAAIDGDTATCLAGSFVRLRRLS